MSARMLLWLEWLYRCCLYLYPRPFRFSYREPMLQTLRDAARDPGLARAPFLFLLFTDLVRSSIQERYAMYREKFGRQLFVFHALLLAGVVSLLTLVVYGCVQQAFRMGGNDPQFQMANDAAVQLSQGAEAGATVPGARVDAASSLAPFLIVYNDAGQPQASSGVLNGVVPVPPRGVLDYVRGHGQEEVTWQPQRGVRIASVIRRVEGPHPGFVLAGRSLQEVEMRIDNLGKLVGVGWMGMMGLIVVSTAVFGWYGRRESQAG